MRKVYLIVWLLTLASLCNSMDVKVNLFTGQGIWDIEIGHHSGRYVISLGELEVTTLSHGETVTFTYADTVIRLMENGVVKAEAATFNIKGVGMCNSFILKSGKIPVRYYDDDLLLELHQGAIRLTNIVDLESYVGGVVQAESGGSTNNVEFFMVQAIVSRTYAMRLILINGSDFCLKDDVSNQVFKGRAVKPQITEAVTRTTGEVILYDDSNLINAVFHSNSGGHTLASDDVWVSSLPYLRAVEDTFSVGQRNYLWTFSMPVVDWLNYLDTNWNYPVENDSMKFLALNHKQIQRTKYFLNNIPLSRMRSDLKLKSTYFDIVVEHDVVVFKGKGYGHGVGLSQEGAIRMADLGYPSHDILKFYYSGIEIKTLSDLNIMASVQ